MNYTIGQISKMCGLPISTLRYYDNQGLFPHMERESGVRRFSERELETIRMIECLKRSGLELKDIKKYMDWCVEGPSTYQKRKALFDDRKAIVEAEIAHMERVLSMLKFKCWYYETALRDGNESRLRDMMKNGFPSEIQALYDKAHEK